MLIWIIRSVHDRNSQCIEMYKACYNSTSKFAVLLLQCSRLFRELMNKEVDWTLFALSPLKYRYRCCWIYLGKQQMFDCISVVTIAM